MLVFHAMNTAVQVLQNQIADLIDASLQPQSELAVWALIHEAADNSWKPWQSARTPEEALAIFREKFEEAYDNLTCYPRLEPEPPAGETESKLASMPEPVA